MEKGTEGELEWRRASALLGQIPQDVPVPEQAARCLNLLDEKIKVVQGPGDALIHDWESISKDPRWVHLSIPGTRHILSFHLSRDRSSLDVHSMGNLDWSTLTWLTFSAAHARAIDTLHSRGAISAEEKERLTKQVFTAESFTLGYGAPEESQRFSPRERVRLPRFSLPILATTALVGMSSIVGIEDALVQLFIMIIAMIAAVAALFMVLYIIGMPLILLDEQLMPGKVREKLPLLAGFLDMDLIDDAKEAWMEYGELFHPERAWRAETAPHGGADSPKGRSPHLLTGSMESNQSYLRENSPLPIERKSA